LIVLSAALLVLALACGPSAQEEAETSNPVDSPTSAPSVNVAEPTAAAPAEPVSETTPAIQETEPVSSAIDNPAPREPGATPATAADAGPEPTATTTVQELAAVVEANPVAETGEPEPTPAVERERAEGPLAAEPVGIQTWINTDPLTLEQLRGKVVLVDFWTYTCVNCIRTFPYLKLWHSRYADDGLVILGIHTPEFEFEKDYTNVLQATLDNGIAWPVAQDNDFETWMPTTTAIGPPST